MFRILLKIYLLWNETTLVSDYPGRDVIIARRSGSSWFIGGINGENVAKKILHPLTFLKQQKNYHIKLITDAHHSKKFSYQEITLNGNDSISLTLLPAGGFTAVID